MACICLSVQKLLWLNGLIIFNWQLIAPKMDWMTYVNAESLSVIRSFSGPKMHIALLISAFAMTHADSDSIGTVSTKLVFVQVTTKRYFK